MEMIHQKMSEWVLEVSRGGPHEEAARGSMGTILFKRYLPPHQHTHTHTHQHTQTRTHTHPHIHTHTHTPCCSQFIADIKGDNPELNLLPGGWAGRGQEGRGRGEWTASLGVGEAEGVLFLGLEKNGRLDALLASLLPSLPQR